MIRNCFRLLTAVVLITFTFVLQISAQEKVKEIPLVYSSENSVALSTASLSTVHLPDFEDLPVIETLPDPFAWSDGSGRQNAYGRLLV